ncbi:MAG: flavodoxin-dependent (E)-4-hydroxy-3-methylbut-2-enyl-diphosphate synthase, partial [Desulfovibrio sp.]|nr:flavodoxin-dependent (E)-4-hydroxy-3-methylbut-2-enyl-diphosphate synthase [Desulfovibrio sp.]
MGTGKTRSIRLGGTAIGGGAPVMVQSMTNTDTRDVSSTLAQIARLGEYGCEAVRLAVPDEAAARGLAAIRKGTRLPLIADIHFDYRLALAAVEAGVEGLRINPGNIRKKPHLYRIVDAAKMHKAVIRVGVNGGS